MPEGKLRMTVYEKGKPERVMELSRTDSYDQLVGMIKVLASKYEPWGIPILMTRQELLDLNGKGLHIAYNADSADVTITFIDPEKIDG